MNVEREYRNFVSGIMDRAKLFPKKHGNWGRVNLSDGRAIGIDTWNKATNLLAGQDDPEYWTGFRDVTTLSYIGIDFGSIEVKDPGTMRDVARELGIDLEAA